MIILSVTGLYKVKIDELKRLFTLVKDLGYRIVAPKVVDGVIRLEYINSFDEIPHDIKDIQEPGRYRLVKGKFFRHGPDSPKKFLYPPRLTLFKITRDWRIEFPKYDTQRIAFFGIKPCDLAAIHVMDRVQGSLGDEYYLALRSKLLIIVENCIEPANTCFCSTMGTGPRARYGFDLAYTRIPERDVVILEAGNDLGIKLMSQLHVEPIDNETYRLFEEVMRRAYEKARAGFNVDNLPELLELRIESEVYKKVTERCLGCANCNMVCPTCFCFDVEDIPYLDGSAERVRIWDGCFSYRYAEVAGGHFRPSLWARYRHWLLHKFSYWIKQFGTFGCVGCGRCITWCPAGIDLRETIKMLIKEVRS